MGKLIHKKPHGLVHSPNDYKEQDYTVIVAKDVMEGMSVYTVSGFRCAHAIRACNANDVEIAYEGGAMQRRKDDALVIDGDDLATALLLARYPELPRRRLNSKMSHSLTRQAIIGFVKGLMPPP